MDRNFHFDNGPLQQTTQLLTDGPAICQIGIKPETGSSVQKEDLGVTYTLHL